MKKLLLLLTVLSFQVQAGLKELTWHSRANCGNNESITWHFGHSYSLLINAVHTRKFERHFLSAHPDGFVWTWRAAAIHWGEALPGHGWSVYAEHKIRDNRGNQRTLGITDVIDCSIYNGWWDK